MDSIQAHTELMRNAIPGRCIEPGGVFCAVRGNDDEPLIFSVGSNHHLYLIKKHPNSEENVELDLSDAFKLPHSHIVHSLAVTQDLSLTIHIVFAAGPPNARSDIKIARPVTPEEVSSWTPTSDLSSHLLPGQAKDIHVQKVYLGTSAEGLDNSPYPPIFIQFRPLEKTTFDFCTIVVNEHGTDWIFNDTIQSPINSHRILDLRATTINGCRGIFALTREGPDDQAVSQLRLLSLFESGGVFTLQNYIQTCPPRACRIATLTNTNGNDDLLIFGDGLHLLRGENCPRGQRGPELQVLSLEGQYDDPSQVHVTQGTNGISVWLQSAGHDVCYQEFSSLNAPCLQPRGPVIPLLVHNAGGGSFSAVRGANGGQQLFVMGTQGGQPALTMLAQNTSTRLWNSSPLVIPTLHEMVQFVSYTSRVELRDAEGAPLGEREVLISTSIPCEIIINGLRVSTDEVGKLVYTDAGGSLTIIVPGTEDSPPANCPIITLAPAAGSGKTFKCSSFSINPATKLSDATEKMSSVDELKRLRDKGLIPKDITDKELRKAADAFSSLRQVAVSLDSQGQVQPSIAGSSTAEVGSMAASSRTNAVSSSPSSHQDLWTLIKEGFDEVVSWTIELVEDGWAFVLKLADETYQLLVKSLSHVVQAAMKILEYIKMGIDKVIEYVGFLFDWDDIVATKNILVNLTTQGMIWASDGLDELQHTCQEFFSDMHSMVLDLKTKPLPPVLQHQKIGKDTAKKASDENKEVDSQIKSPGMCWGHYQLQHGGRTVTSQQTEGRKSGSSIGGIDSSIWDEISKLVEHLTANFSKLFQSSSDKPFGQLLLELGIDLIADIIAVTGKMVSQLIGLFRQLILRLAHGANTEITIPVLSPLYKSISGGAPLTGMDGICLVMAIPMSVTYKLFKGESPTKINGVEHLLKSNVYLPELQSRLNRPPSAAAAPPPPASPKTTLPSKSLFLNTMAMMQPMPLAAVSASAAAQQKQKKDIDIQDTQLAKDFDVVNELIDRGMPLGCAIWFNVKTIPSWANPGKDRPVDDTAMIAALLVWLSQIQRVGPKDVPGFYWRLGTWLSGIVGVVAAEFSKIPKCTLQIVSSVLQLAGSIGSYAKLIANGVDVDIYSLVEDFVIVVGKAAAAIADMSNGANVYVTGGAAIINYSGFAMRIISPTSKRHGYRSGMDLKF